MLAADNGERRWLELHLPFTTSASMAQRIAKIELLRHRFGEREPSCSTWRATSLRLSTSSWRDSLPGILGQTSGSRSHAAEIECTAGQCFARNRDRCSGNGSEHLRLEHRRRIKSGGLPADQVAHQHGGRNTTIPMVPWLRDTFHRRRLLSGNRKPGELRNPAGLWGDAQGNATMAMQIKGTPPINNLAQISPPQISVTVGTSGSLPPGEYWVGFSASTAACPAPRTAPIWLWSSRIFPPLRRPQTTDLLR